MSKLIVAFALLSSTSAFAADLTLDWNGTCTTTQVGGSGALELTKTFNGTNYDVHMEGALNISSPTYGYVRHELPAGFLPIAQTGGFECSVQMSSTCGDTTGRVQYGISGVSVLADTFAGYDNGAIWFPERSCNGSFDVVCDWVTDDAAMYDSSWDSCSGISYSATSAAPALDLQGTCPGAVSAIASNLSPNGEYALLTGDAVGTTVVPLGVCAGTTLDIDQARFRRLGAVDAQGQADLSANIAARFCGQQVQILDMDTCTVTPVQTL